MRARSLSVILAGVLLQTSASGQFVFETGTIPQQGDPQNGFGRTVEMSNDRIFVGLNGPFGLENVITPVYVFNDAGVFLGEILPEEPGLSDWFGSDIAVDGNLLAVGARWAKGLGTSITEGAVYLFDLTTGEQLRIFRPNPEYDDRYFGAYVALSDRRLIVGNGGNGGSTVYVFDCDTGEVITTIATDLGTTRGRNVAIQGNVAVVGSGDGASRPNGRAYAYNATSGAMLFELVPELSSQYDHYGEAIAMNHDVIVVGSPGRDSGVDPGFVSVFDIHTGQLIRTLRASDAQPGDMFGQSVSIDGDVLIVGATNTRTSLLVPGGAFVFDLDSGRQVVKLGSDHAFWASLGYSVATRNGTVAVSSFGNTSNAWDGYFYRIDLGYCAADLNRDGTLDSQDFAAWIMLFAIPSPECDQNADGLCTPADFTAWIANFKAGC